MGMPGRILTAREPRRPKWLAPMLVTLSLALWAAGALGQDSTAGQSGNQQGQANGDSNQQDQATPSAGGPGGDSGAIAIPKKAEKPDTPPPAPAQPKVTNPPELQNFSLKIDVPEVTVDVGVIVQKTGQFVPGLKPGNFRVYEDGVQQKIEGFKRTEAPITVLMLCEYAARGWIFRVDMLNAASAFTQQLRPKDFAAMMTFDLNAHIVSDFTQDKQQIRQGINQLANQVYMPAAFSETNLFDALNEALDRLSRVEGQKYLVLIASGIDTFSKLNLDEILKRVKASRDITIFTISTGGFLQAVTEGTGGLMGGIRDLTYLQANNQMKTFSDLTGGMHFEPRFTGELPDDVKAINDNIRSKYELIYRPTNSKQDGTYRKLRVMLVDDEGQPLRIQDEKHKPLKYNVIARDGYRAKQEVE
jgi:VWFA-related protein